MSQAALSGFSLKSLQKLKRRVEREIKRRSLSNKPTKVKYNPGGRVRRWNLYVLLLQGNNYYVGITAQKVKKRLKQHAEGSGSRWTSKYRPIGIIEEYSIGVMCESDAVKVETEKTMDVIAEHGISKVRGGSLVRVDEAKVNKAYQRLLKIQGKGVASTLTL